MACGPGCCGPPRVEASAPTDPTLSLGGSSGCEDAASCAGSSNNKASVRAEADTQDKDSCKDGCCGSSGAKITTAAESGSSTAAANAKENSSKQAQVLDSSDKACEKFCCGSSMAAKPAEFSCAKVAGDNQDGCCGDKGSKESGVKCLLNIASKSCDMKSGGQADDCCAPEVVMEDDCQKGCCGSTDQAKLSDCPSTSLEKDECCETKMKAKDECSKGCCGSGENKPTASRTASATVKDDCGSQKFKVKDDCKKKCCSTSPATVQSGPVPSCCGGRTSPCCDTTCIDRLALRECIAEKQTTFQTSGKASLDADGCNGGRDGKACRGHSRTVRETYQAKLEALGCICRALLALGQESCCGPRELSSIERKRSSAASLRSRPSIDSCCDSGASRSACTTKTRTKNGCRPPSPKPNKGGCADACCAAPTAPSIAASCADSCCGDDEPPDSGIFKKAGPEVTNATDLERGMSGKEHVVLSISGMTCTGCETKLKRTLATVDAVKNLKTSLVLARAEFDLDLGIGTTDDVIKHLERTTEFKCEKITSQGASIDILTPGSPEDFISQAWPEGVTDIRVVDSKTVHVEFDAEIIGARDLVEKGWGDPVKLAPPRADPTLEAGSKHVRKVGLMTLLSAILTIPVLVMSWAPLPENEIAYGSASLVLATIVQFAIAGPFYPKALKSLIFSRMIEMDLLIVLSTSAAYIFSVVSFGYLVSHQPLSTGEFFETSTLLVSLIMVGRYVSALARQKAVESISIRSLQVSTASIVDSTGQMKAIDSRLLQYGDVFQVAPDSRVPTDGTVVSGSSELDESMITGESRVIEKYPGSSVIAGSINGSGTLNIRLTRLPGDNTISNIAGMVDEAKLSKPKIQDIADRVASYFVPVVVTITIITFVIWIAVGVALRKQSGSEATIQAITYAITVLIVSCPCAIGLAVPMVIVIASGVAAERGVIFKSADSIEVAYKTSHVVFDKTGTLTEGKLSIAKEWYLSDQPDATQALLLGLVGHIRHPVSAAVAAHLKEKGISPVPVSDPKTLTGKGVEATAAGNVLRAGNSRWLGLSSNAQVESILGQGFTAFCFTIDGKLAAVFALQDSVRSDARETISQLQISGISVHVLSGDDTGAVRVVTSQLGIHEDNVRSRCSPKDKQEYIQRLLETPSLNGNSKKHKKPVVVFCGDGTNDSVALAQATIGVHMNEGTDVAKSAADVVLMRPSLSGILTAIAISKKAMHRIAFNFGWSFVYNVFAILLGSGAFVKARIPPEFAGLGELASVLPVIAAAVLLRWSKV